MFVIRFVIRVVMFFLAISAMVVILGTGFWAFSGASSSFDGSIELSEGQGIACAKSPGTIEEIFLNFYLQGQSSVINTPISTDPAPVPFKIEFGETARLVSEKLVAQGFITDADVFRLFLRYNGMDATLEAGDYQLRRNMDMCDIALALQRANFEEVVITIPEGWRAEQIAELLTQAEVMDGGLFLGMVRQGVGVDHPLLADRPVGASYEGYLFPDTYRLAVNSQPEELIQRMVETMAARVPSNAVQLANAQGRTFYETLVIASIVEREAVLASERPTIASVYLNRITQGMRLQADPTVQYAMGYQPDTQQWWKTPVTLEEYQNVNSPYNTYLFDGLPPSPIANPGAASIQAALQPDQTDYLFFMGCSADGGHVFALDFATHEQNVARCSGRG